MVNAPGFEHSVQLWCGSISIQKIKESFEFLVDSKVPRMPCHFCPGPHTAAHFGIQSFTGYGNSADVAKPEAQWTIPRLQTFHPALYPTSPPCPR